MSDIPARALFREAARLSPGQWPARYPGRRAMGYLCSYVPEEMIHAAGWTPVRLRGSGTPLRHADAHLQSFTCALCRSTLDQLLAGELAPALDGLIFAHTCDALQAQADLWARHSPRGHLVDTVMQPANLGSPAARPYLLAELERFRQRLADWTGRRLSDGDLRDSIALYDETRRLVGALHGRRADLDAATFYTVLDAAQAMPREEFNPLLADFLAALPAATGGAGRQIPGPRLFLAGAVLDEPRLTEMIDELGAFVAGDDLCTGTRHFHGDVGREGDPLAALADYYLRRPPCPTKHHAAHEPGRHLVDQARRVQADGVLFVLAKFCEPHAFDYALVLPALERAGLPHLLLEMDQVPAMEAQRTRLQAFIEML